MMWKIKTHRLSAHPDDGWEGKCIGEIGGSIRKRKRGRTYFYYDFKEFFVFLLYEKIICFPGGREYYVGVIYFVYVDGKNLISAGRKKDKKAFAPCFSHHYYNNTTTEAMKYFLLNEGEKQPVLLKAQEQLRE